MPENPRIYSSTNAPGTPKQGDIRYDQSNSRIEVYTGSAWGQVDFTNLNAQTTVVTGLTSDSYTISAGYASTNSTGPAFYIPTVGGAPTGAVASLGGRAALAFDTVTRALRVRVGGSWYTTASMSLG